MTNIPTSQEVLDSNLGFDEFNQPIWANKSVKRAMIEFAKLHVDAALKTAAEQVTIQTSFGGMSVPIVNKLSILNAYPKENIR